jgi:hypothetical protein
LKKFGSNRKVQYFQGKSKYVQIPKKKFGRPERILLKLKKPGIEKEVKEG